MLPDIQIFNRYIPLYSIMIIIGIIFGVLFALKKCKLYNISKEDIIFAYCYALIGLLIGGKILYILTDLKGIIANRHIIFSDIHTFVEWIKGGFVFYGGLFGAIFMVMLYCKKYKIDKNGILPIMITTVPLIHSFGRIGCFCAGCCYGIKYDGPFSVQFKESHIAPNFISLFPVQLLESILNMAIFLIMAYYLKKKFPYLFYYGLYFAMYSLLRFGLESLRGDIIRGIIGIFSVSQWISIVTLLLGIVLIFLSLKKKNAE